MLRNDLLENGYYFKTIEPRKSMIKLIWAAFALLFTAAAAVIYFSIFTGYIERTNLPLFYVDIHVYILNAIFIGTPLIYFISKELLTALSCSHQKEQVELKLYSDAGMPITASREAFKTWQIIGIYLTPLLIIYPLLIMAGIVSGGNIFLLILTLIMSFYMAFDLTLVIYVIYLKIRYDADYIAVKKHVYNFTLYSESYIKRREYSDFIKEKLGKIKRIYKTPAAKIIGGSVILVWLTSVLIYNFALNKEKDPDDFSNSYNIRDALRISAYLFDDGAADGSYALERLKINETRVMAPVSAAGADESALYLEFDGIRAIVSKIDINSEDIVLSYNGTLFEGFVNIFPSSLAAEGEHYLTVYAYKDELSGYPRITARLRLTVSDVVSIELTAYEISHNDRIMYGIFEDDD